VTPNRPGEKPATTTAATTGSRPAPSRRPRPWQILAATWAVGTVAAGAVLIGTGSPAVDGHGDTGHGSAHPAEADRQAVVTVSEPAPLGTGTARLEIAAARKDSSDVVLAGRPVTFRVRLDGVSDPGTVSLGAERIGRGSAVAESVALERSGSVAIDTASGELYLLTGSAEHDHDSGHGAAGTSAGNGAGLASVAGSAAEWAARLTPGSAPQVSPDGRWVAAAHVGHPLVDVVDTLLHTVRAVPLPAPAVALAFEAGTDRLWSVDATGGLTSIDPAAAAATATRQLGLGTAAPAVVVAAPGSGLLYVGTKPGGAAAVVPTGDGAAAVVVPGGGLAQVAWSAGLGAFVGLDADGSVVAVSADGGRRTVATNGGPGNGTALLAVHPAGRTAVTVRGTTAEVLELATGRVTGRAGTGPDPRQVVVVDHFAVVRDGKDASLVWVDLDQPERSAELPLGTDGPPAGLTVSADGAEVSVAVPSQRKVLRADIMMGRPMVMASEPTGLTADLVVRSRTRLVATDPATWELTTVLPLEGSYRIAVRTAVGEASFTVEVAAEGRPARVVDEPQQLATDVERSVTLQFTYGGEAPEQLDLVAYAEAEAVQQRLVASRLNVDGELATYSAAFTPTVTGRHQVFVTPAGGTPISDALVASVTVAPGR
jgi:hypothetical protein